MEGWIKLHRKIVDSPLWNNLNSDQKVVMINCLLKANHKPKKWIWNGEEMTLDPGDMIISYHKFSAICGVSVQSLRTSVSKLEKFGFLTRTSTNKSTKLTICKWDTYQGIENLTNKQPNDQLTNDQQTTNKRLTTNNNVKKGNNDNNVGEEIRIDFWKNRLISECSIVLDTLKSKHTSKKIDWDKELNSWNSWIESEKKSPDSRNALFHSFNKWIEYAVDKKKKPTSNDKNQGLILH